VTPSSGSENNLGASAEALTTQAVVDEPADVASRIVSGVAWKAGSQITLQISRMVVALFVARVLAPEEWGLAAMVMVFSGFVIVFTDNALGTALIQHRAITENDRSTVFWISSAVGLLLMACGVAISGVLADFYGEPAVAPLFAVLSVSFFINSLATTHSALLVRAMRFRQLELRQMAATASGAVTGIALAVGGFGAWAIVGQQLAEAATSTVLLWWWARWRPSFAFSLDSVRKLGGFAGNVFGENIVAQSSRSVTSLVMGRVLGPVALGTYTLGANVILVPFSRIAAPMQQVFFPAFTRIREDRERLAELWIRASRVVGLVSVPALVGLACVAPDFVAVVLGPKWAGVTTVIQLLAWVGIIASLQTLSAEVLLALGRAGTLFMLTLASFSVGTVAFVGGLHWGVNGAAAAVLLVTLLIEPLRTYATTRALGIHFLTFVRAFGGIAQSATLMAVSVIVAREVLLRTAVPVAARLTMLVTIGTIVYVGFSLWRVPEITLELAAVRRRARQRTTTPVDAVDAPAA
jgi:O-antigen/teichoic acid export membrane protein